MQIKTRTFVEQTDKAPLATIRLFGVPLITLTEQQCIKYILDQLELGQGGWCLTVNLDILRQIVTMPKLRRFTQKPIICIADGISLVWASRIKGTPLPERVCGSNLIYSLTEKTAQRGRSVFLLGGNPGIAEKAAKVLEQRYKGLIVAGTYCPNFGFEQNPQQIQKIAEAIETAQPDIVYVALGFPKADFLIEKIRHVCPQAWWIGVGISFSYVAGEFKRAPLWIQKVGFETFYRVLLEPRRLAKRFLLIGPLFVSVLLAFSLFERARLFIFSKKA